MSDTEQQLSGTAELQSMNAEQARVLLGIGLRTVRRLIADGKLATYRVGRRVCISVAALRAYQEQNKHRGCV